MIELLHGDMLDKLDEFADGWIDAVITDPPYHLVTQKEIAGGKPTSHEGPHKRFQKGFMGCQWDGGDIAFRPETWAEVLRVMKPGGHMACFGGSRTHHRMMCAIEDAGFEIRDVCMWYHLQGFPKSKNVSLGIDKEFGHGDRGRAIPVASSHLPHGRYAEEKLTDNRVPEYQARSPEAEQWQGWQSALKPAFEPIVIARKPLESTIAKNVMKYGTGALNIDATRVGDEMISTHHAPSGTFAGGEAGRGSDTTSYKNHTGRWPANILLENNDILGERSRFFNVTGYDEDEIQRLFYSPKASKKDRAGSKHPTVKPIALMRWLCRLITPPNGIILDPFAGSGSTGEAAFREGFNCIMIEREDQYAEDIRNRIASLEKELIIV